jgi:sugar phosphate isomerase/epimerase
MRKFGGWSTFVQELGVYSSREFGRTALISLTLPSLQAHSNAASRSSLVNGVRIGAITFSFRDLPRMPEVDKVDVIIKEMRDLGFSECEIMPDDMVPGRLAPPRSGSTTWSSAARIRWLDTPLDYFKAIRKKFADAGISVHCFMGIGAKTAVKMDLDFSIAKALGARFKGRPVGTDAIKRMAPFAAKHKMSVYVHNENKVSPADLAGVLDISPWIRVNLDLGHFVVAGGDSVAFINQYHSRISHLHVKDCRKTGENVLMGEGDTPVKDVLRLIRDKHYDIPAYVEYEVPGPGPYVEGVRQYLNYMKQAIAS